MWYLFVVGLDRSQLVYNLRNCVYFFVFSHLSWALNCTIKAGEYKSTISPPPPPPPENYLKLKFLIFTKKGLAGFEPTLPRF